MGANLPISVAARSCEETQAEQRISTRKLQRTVRVGSVIIRFTNRNVALRSCCDAKQQRCHGGFALYPSYFPRVFGGRESGDCPEMVFACLAQGKIFRGRT